MWGTSNYKIIKLIFINIEKNKNRVIGAKGAMKFFVFLFLNI